MVIKEIPHLGNMPPLCNLNALVVGGVPVMMLNENAKEAEGVGKEDITREFANLCKFLLFKLSRAKRRTAYSQEMSLTM